MKSESIRIEGEIELARNIQQQLIPSKNPDKNIYSFYKPMNRVGGDFYDFILFRDSDKIGIFLSDVSGHGVPAAFITTIIKTGIFQSGMAKEDPASLLMFLNNILIHHSGGNFVTAFYGIYNPSDRSLVFSNAGHNSPFLINSYGVNDLKGSKSKPLAIMSNEQLIEKNQSYSNTEVYLEKSSKLLLYTDGLVETTSKNDKNLYFEDAGMYQLLADLQKLPCGDFIKNIYRNLIQFSGNENFEDDICMICVDIV
jgi:serine phosphatase RsbU (regulator of sigma subunit)